MKAKDLVKNFIPSAVKMAANKNSLHIYGVNVLYNIGSLRITIHPVIEKIDLICVMVLNNNSRNDGVTIQHLLMDCDGEIILY